MATEHVEEYGRGEKMDGKWDMHRGWGRSSPSRFYPTCSWRPWGDTSSRDVASSEDRWGKVSQPAESSRDEWGEASQSAGDGWGQVSESVADGWGQATESVADGWGQASETTGDGWGRAAESNWCDLDDPYAEFEEPRESESARKCSGLTNLGNTCFMNSVLQCLTFTVPFANRIMSNQHKLSCQTQGFCVMCAIQDHMKVVLSGSGRTVSPSYLAHNLSHISRSFALGQQQDAHEFLLYLMEGMQKSCKSDGSSTTQAGDTSSVSEIFIGKMKSQVKCKSCAHCSDSVEPFLGLNLEIENCDSLKDALSNFLAVEELEEENKISCSHCKEDASRSKQLSFSKSPQALVIQLKRYKATEIFPTKIERDVKYELFLDLLPFISKEDDVLVQECDWKYKLYAVLVHSGWSTASGHYYCYVQTSPGIWQCMNDSSVSRVNEWTVLHQEAYILFYIREGMNEELHFENATGVEPEKETESHQFQTSEKMDSPIMDDSVSNKPSLLVNNQAEEPAIARQAVLTEPLESFSQVSMEIDVEAPIVCSQVKSPGVLEQSERDNDTRAPAPPAPQAPKQSLPSPRGESLRDLEERKSPCIKGQSSLKAEKMPSPLPCIGGTHVVLDTFENGSQHSFLRLLNKMPSTRRQALLASALSGQEAVKQSSPTAKVVKDKSKQLKTTKQVQSGRTSPLVQDTEQKSVRSREKPWNDEYDHIDTRKTQRVGGKRVMASFRSPGVQHQQGVAKANIV